MKQAIRICLNFLKKYNNEYAKSFKRLAIFSETSDSYNPSWRNIADKNIYYIFRKILKRNDIAFFKDGIMVYSDIFAFKGTKRLLLNIHSYVTGYGSPLEYVQQNEPDQFINCKELYTKYVKSRNYDKLYLFIISNIKSQCKKDFLINYLDEVISKENAHLGIVLFDDNFLDYELNTLENNKNYSLQLFKLSSEECSDLDKLANANLGFTTNLLFIFNSNGDLLDACHIFADCPFLDNYF